MKQHSLIQPKNRINSIDALRGFALLGILLLHCMEHFDLTYTPTLSSPFWQSVDNIVDQTIHFLFQGKSYAIFSLLFGLSFFMQMDSQAEKGKDFRGRFLWRLVILFVFGYINGLIYMGEFFVIYAVLGVILIPLYKVPTKWLLILAILLFLQIPQLIHFFSALHHPAAEGGSSPMINYMNELYGQSAEVYINGSFWDMIRFNLVKGQTAKVLWFIAVNRYLQLVGLFIAGMLIGRSGAHKSEEKMVAYGKKGFLWALGSFILFYGLTWILPYCGMPESAANIGMGLLHSYSNLGLMMIYVCGFTLLYYKTKIGKSILTPLAPVGRMSVTNYMVQSTMGVLLFYGFCLNMSVRCSLLECALAGLAVCILQIVYSNWWMKRFYYGPMEWLWRRLTWFAPVPMRRK